MATFYFDGHSGISDPDAKWTNDENGFNGDVPTYALCGVLGTETTNELRGQGTTAPDSSGKTIINVYIRVFASSNFGGVGDRTDINIYTDGEAELLASLSYVDHGSYSAYTLLTPPSGGWTWASLRELELVAWVVVSDGEQRIHKVELEVITESVGEVVYFDASDASATDPNSQWTGDANAFNGDLLTAATSQSDGTTSLNYLMAEGTNAPSTGGIIKQVNARHYDSNGSSSSGLNRKCYVYTDGLAELLGNTDRDNVATAGWSSYATLSTPSGGWTWAKVKTLEVKITGNGSASVTASIYRVELQVILEAKANIYSKQGFQ